MFAPRGAEACATSYDNWLTTGLPQSLKQPRLPPLPRSEYLATGEQPKAVLRTIGRVGRGQGTGWVWPAPRRKGWYGPRPTDHKVQAVLLFPGLSITGGTLRCSWTQHDP